MTPQLSHIAIASPSIEKIADKLRSLSLQISEFHDVPSEKVRAGMVSVKFSRHFRIELLEPTEENSPISKFLNKRPLGGIHHLCFEVSGIEQWVKQLQEAGLEILPPGIRKGSRGRALFIHPKSMGGVLIELEEISHGA